MVDQKAFTFPFEDEEWVNKLLIGSLLYLVAPFLFGIPLIIPRGYALRIWHDASAGRSPHLPAWDRWEDMGLQGLAYYVMLFIYSLPLWFLGVFAVLAAAGGGVAVAAVAGEFEAGGTSAIWPGGIALLLAAGIGLTVLLGLVLTFLIGLLFPMAVGRYVETRRFGAAFELGAVWRAMLANLGGLVVIWLILLVAALVLGSLISLGSTILCWIPFVNYLLMSPVAFYLSLVQARLMGQAYHQAQHRLGSVPTVSEPPLAPAFDAPGLVEEKVERPVTVPIETLGLSARVVRALDDAGVVTVGQVVERLAEGDAAVLSIQGVGAKALEEIKVQLATHGFLDP